MYQYWHNLCANSDKHETFTLLLCIDFNSELNYKFKLFEGFYLHVKFCFGPKKRQPKFQLIDLLEAFLLVSNIINSNVHVIHPYKLAFYVQQLKMKWNFAFCCTVFGIKVICTIFCFVLFLANPFRITEKSTENEN